MEEICIYQNEKNITFGVIEKKLTKEQKDFLREFAEYVKKNNIESKVNVSIVSFDKNKIINRINIYIENDKYKLCIKNVYCGGVRETDRIYTVLYSFEHLLSKLIEDNFECYEKYSFSNKYKLL